MSDQSKQLKNQQASGKRNSELNIETHHTCNKDAIRDSKDPFNIINQLIGR